MAPARHCNNCRTPCSDPLGSRIDPGLGGQLQPPVVDSTRNRNPTEPIDTWHYVLQQRATAVVCGTPPTELSAAGLNAQLRHSCMPTRRLGNLLHAIMQMTRGFLNQTATWAEWRAGPQQILHKRNVNWQPPTPAHAPDNHSQQRELSGRPSAALLSCTCCACTKPSSAPHCACPPRLGMQHHKQWPQTADPRGRLSKPSGADTCNNPAVQRPN